jgi:hypothetical protein
VARLDDMVKRNFLTLPGLELLTVGCPSYGQSLYRPTSRRPHTGFVYIVRRVISATSLTLL